MADDDIPPWERGDIAPSADIPPWDQESMSHTPPTAEKKAKDEKAGLAAEGVAMGVTDPVYGAAQLGLETTATAMPSALKQFDAWLAKTTGSSVFSPRETLNKFVSDREKKHEDRRGSDAGIDWARVVGNAAPAAAGGAFSIPEQAAVRAGPWGAAATKGLLEAAKRVGTAAGVGGAAGAAEPVVGDDFWTKKLAQTGTGAVLGGVLGLGGEAVTKGVEALGATLARNNPEALNDEAIKTILRRMNQDTKGGGPTVQQVLDLISTANQRGIPLSIVDAGGGNTRGLAGNVTRQPGASREASQTFLKMRDQLAPMRLRKALDENLHGGPTMHQTGELLLQSRSAAARPAYAELDNLQNIWSPKLQQYLDDPVLQEGLKRGMKLERIRALAEDRPFNPTQMGVDLDAEGNVKFVTAPNMRVLDIAKQGLDDIVANSRNEITGRLTMEGKLVNDLRNVYLQEVDSLDKKGVYKAARDTWAGPSASFDAMRYGRSVFMNSPEENAAHLARLSPANQEFARIGVADMLTERMMKAGFSGDEAKALIKNEWTKQQLRPYFKSDKEFNAFVDSVTAERQMFGTSQKMLGGSETAERVAEDQTSAALGAAKGMWATGLFHKAVNMFKMYQELGLKPNPELNEKIARILFQAPITQENRLALQGAKKKAALTKLQQFGQSLKRDAGTGEGAAAGGVSATAGHAIGDQE